MRLSSDDHTAPRAIGLRERVLAAASDRLPLGIRAARLAPTARAAAALAAVGLLAAVLAAVLLLRSRPHEVTAPIAPPTASVTSGPVAASTPPATAGGSAPGGSAADGPRAGGLVSSGSPQPTSTALVVVDVVGQVRRPGVVRLPPGSRVVDALASAGGLRPGARAGTVNLAAVLVDGQQIVVGGSAPPAPPTAAGAPGAAGPPAAAGAAAAAGVAGPTNAMASVDLNTATLEQLDQLPGVGPVLAQRILEWRAANGRFSSIDQLAEVGGIGERKLADLRGRVRV